MSEDEKCFFLVTDVHYEPDEQTTAKKQVNLQL